MAAVVALTTIYGIGAWYALRQEMNATAASFVIAGSVLPCVVLAVLIIARTSKVSVSSRQHGNVEGFPVGISD